MNAQSTFDLDGMLKRLHLPTVRRLYAELEDRAEQEEMSYRDYLALLMAEEIAHRTQTRIQRSVRKAKFPFLQSIEDFDFTFQTSVRLQLLGSFLGPELVSEGRNLVLSGPTGTGKTRLAISIAFRAIQNGFEARFTTAAELIEELSNAARTGQLGKALHTYIHPHVLVVDEIGYLSLKDNAANVLFQVVNERYLQRKPLLFTTNKPLAAWGHVLHDPDLAEAILERGRHIQLRGSSYRTRHHQRKEKDSHSSHEAPGAIFSGNLVPDFPEPTPLVRTRTQPSRSSISNTSPIFIGECMDREGKRQSAGNGPALVTVPSSGGPASLEWLDGPSIEPSAICIQMCAGQCRRRWRLNPAQNDARREWRLGPVGHR